MNIIPCEIWIKIINYLGQSKYDLYFTNQEFFSLIKYEKSRKNIINVAIKKGNLCVLKYINNLLKQKDNLVVENESFKNKGKDKYLRLSCRYGHLPIVEYFIQCGANVNKKDNYAVRVACKKGHLDVVKYLVENGANIRARENDALILASERGHLDVVKYLVGYGLDVIKDTRVLERAMLNSHSKTVNYLKSQGANLKNNVRKFYYYNPDKPNKIIASCLSDTPKEAGSKFFTREIHKHKSQKKPFKNYVTEITIKEIINDRPRTYKYLAERQELAQPQNITFKTNNGETKTITYNYRNKIHKII
ncbi:putative ankyrin repeat protein [Cotonvirus japonicus]|uniref:Ankyrin repeat protein n=1 Tax=Cotonvirus japonicus TaxID=2811091 RepID=A0ABM7NU07_9VIRU|nr:putative ankyrin repeat protein [Cotonvirus japonicus]BCS83668.1 putative ankyrin repeat protein [Cotonvirus japonicus]